MFKVGDKVWCDYMKLRGVVTYDTYRTLSFPITVKFQSVGFLTFTEDGYYQLLNKDVMIVKTKLINTKYNNLKQGEINDTNK